tara:strand:+ start:564 stop:737 length:174 start_codon:yes stop_codon:yes gene_type:complete
MSSLSSRLKKGLAIAAISASAITLSSCSYICGPRGCCGAKQEIKGCCGARSGCCGAK